MRRGCIYPRVEALSRELPTHTVRSESQIAFQQFSTPPALAMLAVHLARLTPDDVLLEPSAGTGILAMLAQPHVDRLLLNELEPTRAELLEGLFPGVPVTRHDGAEADRASCWCATTERYSHEPAVLGLAIARRRSQYGGPAFAFRARFPAPGGRIVAIMPDWFAPTVRGGDAFCHSLQGARVALSLRLDKGGYAKHGTGIAVRMLVIDKVAGDGAVSTINRQSAGELLAAIATVPHACHCAKRSSRPFPVRPNSGFSVQ
ncbi:hypothetical protein [Croceicoccus naphthovorans]|uniref:hypothetical protein n=1 Tax=Croceicoccus naphthovorans TaxID=1348774 RepID=UPI000B1BFB7D